MLEQNFPPKLIKSKKFIYKVVGKALDRQNFLINTLRYVVNFGNKLIRVADRHNNYEKFRATVIGQKYTEHGYTGRYDDLKAAMSYANEIAKDFSEKTPTESYLLYQEQIKLLRELIVKTKPKKFFNFGVCYAYIDSILAAEFPDIEFIGIDLSPYNKAFNDVEFKHLPNLTIVAGDAISFISKSDFSNSILFHSRTMFVLPKDFILQLYLVAYKANFQFIVGFEQNGLSYETFEPYIFDLEDKPSVWWRDFMFIHNYLGIATQCGFRIMDSKLFTTSHTNADYKVLSYVAQRIE